MVFASFLLSSSFVGSAIAIAINPHVGTSQLFERSQLLSSTCSTTGLVESCHNTTAVANTCCFEYPGGLLLQPQFWDTNPSTGPTDSWTIHGLWPDHCDQTYSSNCDSSRAYTGIGTLLTNNGASDTLAYMQSYWVDINGANEVFWEHEWAKHGTCMTTLVPSCLPSGSATGAEAVAFFQTVVKLFKTLPTYTWLANAGITPSSAKTYTLSTLTSALKAQSGYTPALDCTSGALNQISWYFYLKGSVIDGTFIPIDAPAAGSCPSSGISYPPKTSGTSTATATTATSTSTSTSTTKTTTTAAATTTTTTSTSTTTASGSLPTKATIHASTTGGLLSAGTWSTQTLATYTLSGTLSSFTMTSSKGSCGVTSGTFSCGSGVTSTTFSAVTSGSTLLLASGGSTSFSSDGIPSGTTVYTVYTGTSHANAYTLTIVSS